MNLTVPVSIKTRVLIKDLNTNEILVDKSNAIHSQNMARILSRALAHETNSWIYRMAFGNGGTQLSADGSRLYNPPNDGSDGSWESRLYNETYSEVVDEISANYGYDVGSSDITGTRPGGGADPSNDPTGGGVFSQEAGLNSNVVVSVILNELEPTGESLTSLIPPTDSEKCFLFDEIGLYSPGKPAVSTSGYTTVNVGNKTSDSYTALIPNSVLNFSVSIDGTSYTSQIKVPASGSGLSGEITYGDLCEALNTGIWTIGGDSVESMLYCYITDNSGGTYPSILGKQSYGYLIFQSKTVGSNSSVLVSCASNASDLLYVITGNNCNNCNIISTTGENAGVQNDPIHPENERERLLTHIIFDPILKSSDRSIGITYTLTVSVDRTDESIVQVNYS